MSKFAMIQMASSHNTFQANLALALEQIEAAKRLGADMAILPEECLCLGVKQSEKITLCDAIAREAIPALAKQAKAQNIWLVAGTIPIKTTDQTKMRSACLVFDNKGIQQARYDKIHLFDVTIDADTSYCESQTVEAGDTPVVLDTPFGKLGLAVCYDLRFPELFRLMARQGAQIFIVPSAFTPETGKYHWHLLTKARAVENLAFVLACDQIGSRVDGKKTYGHSIAYDPWGHTLGQLEKSPGIVLVDIDLPHQKTIRSHFPVLDHIQLTHI